MPLRMLFVRLILADLFCLATEIVDLFQL